MWDIIFYVMAFTLIHRQSFCMFVVQCFMNINNESKIHSTVLTLYTTRAPSEDRLSSLTPKSLASLSPASPSHSNSAQSSFDQTLRDTAEFCEFFYNSDGILEKDFAELTLTGLYNFLRFEK